MLQLSKVDDYAEDGDQGRSDFCVVFTISLCALELKQTLISLVFQIICFEIRYTGSEKLFDPNFCI